MTWNRSEEVKHHPPNKPYCDSYPRPDNELLPLMREYLASRGLDMTTARHNGWYATKGVDGWGRVVVPCKSDQPGNMYWQARLIEPVCGPERPLGGTKPLRWDSPHGVSRGNAVGLVWTPDFGARWNGYSCLVEGPMDALACAEQGYLAVALLSATPSEEVLTLTRKLLHGTLCLCIFDIGAEDPMIHNAGWLRERGVHCRLVNPYPAKDVAAIPRDKRREFLRSQEPR